MTFLAYIILSLILNEVNKFMENWKKTFVKNLFSDDRIKRMEEVVYTTGTIEDKFKHYNNIVSCTNEKVNQKKEELMNKICKEAHISILKKRIVIIKER